MIHRSRHILTTVALFALLAGCRADRASSCATGSRLFRDSVGAAREKERVEVQWVMFRGALDSMLATRSGASSWERAPRSLEEDLAQYADSLRMEGKDLLLGDGCVDWSGTWAEGDFDRFALATAMVRKLFGDTTLSIQQLLPDTASAPRFLDLEMAGGGSEPPIVRIELDSVVARVFSRSH